MLARRTIGVVACGLCLGTAAVAGEEPLPEVDFIEYLGMWQESDDEWLLLDEMEMTDYELTDIEERSDPVPESEESTEKTDES